MNSIYVKYKEFTKFQINIIPNDINDWWKQIVFQMPLDLQPLAKNLKYYFETDMGFAYTHILGQKYILKVNKKSFKVYNYLEINGPFILFVEVN